jgi:hypothetical protein
VLVNTADGAAGAPSTTPLTTWAPTDLDRLASATVCASHRLHRLPMFSDEALSDALDRHPRSDLQVFTMGADPARPEDWTPVEPGEASGADLLEAVRRGRLWLNVLRIDRSDPTFSDLQDRLFEEIGLHRADLEPGSPRSTLLVSSPAAQVYFHVDAGPNILWHVRGTKRVWVFPAHVETLVPRELLEDIFAGVRTENLPYRPAFDAAAEIHDLEPGAVIAWAQNSPHRVENTSAVNVSLSCEFATAGSRRREYTVLANRFLERRLHTPQLSEREFGLAAAAKRFTYRAVRKLRIERTRPHYEYVTDLRIDPTTPDGVSRVATPTLTSFSVT